jgi:branched-chain amino acid aminotransferase
MSLLKTGVKCGVVQMDRSIPGAKKISYADSHVAALQAREDGVGETLLVASDGVVTEGAYSNVFWVKDGQVYTTSVDRVLPGITREIVMELVEVEEVEVGLVALKEADEVFLTKTTLGVVPIIEIDGVDFEEGNVTREIQQKFNEYVKCGMEN